MNNKELEKELEILTAPMESTLSMAEQMNNKNNYEKKVDSLCIESDRLLQESDFDAALFKLIEAYKIISDHPWGIKQRQVYDLIQNAQFKRQNNIKKEELKIQQQREKEIEEKEQQTLIQSHKKELEREHQERENKLKQLQEKKKEEDRISNAAFQLLEEGQVFHKNQQYDELIAKYRQAKNLFLDIKWNTEAEKVENTIQNFIKEKNLALLKDEKEKKSLQEQESTWKAKELELNAQSKKLKELEEKKKLIIQQSLSRKELENQVYADLDKASLYEKSNDLVRALELYGNIKDVMARLGWKQEIIKLNDTIKILENKIWEEQERQKRDLLAKRLKEEEDLEIARRIKEQEVESKNREEQKRKKLEILEKSKQQEKEASEQAFKQIEDIEKEVKFYKEHAIIDKFSLECPYLRAKETYQNSKEILHKIGWKGEASKLDSAISMYEKLYADDQKERVLYNKKREQEIEEQRKLEESIKFQKKEQERREQEKRQKLEGISKKKEQEDQISKVTFQAIEDIEKEVKFYKEHALAEHYALDCPYLRAKNVYEASRNQLLSIGWKKEADKLLSAINMYENFYQKDVLDRKKLQLIEKMDEQEKKRLQETIRLQKEEDELKEMERLKKLTEIEKKKALEEEISKQVFKQIEEIEKEVKEYNEHPINEKITSASPYLRAKNIYQSARDELLKIGWKIEADKLLTPISMYENLHHKDQMEREKLHLIKKKQMEEQKKLEESIRSQTEEVERREQEKRQKLEEISKKKEQEDQISKVAFQAIEDIEKEVKFYKEHALAEHYALDCPYLRAKNVYEASRNQLLSIGWKKEADKLLSAINMYEKLLYTDEIERGKFLEKQEKEKEEKRKLYESIQIQKEERERQERERIRALREQELQKQHETDVSEKAFQLIEDIEKDVTHYRERVKIENYHLPCPYDRAIEVYKTAQKMLMEIGWKKEADKLTNSIRVYDRLSNEDLEIRNKFKAKLEKEKEAERELQETIQREKERLLLEEEKRKSELEKFDKKKRETEQLQQSAYEKLEAGNRYIQEKEFDKASEELQEALKLFKKIKWKSGIKLTENAIKYKENEQEKFERLLQHERLALQEKVKKEQEFQEFLEEQRRIKDQEEQNRKLELLRIEMASKKVSEQQESAFNKLEEGNDLVKIREFDKANKLYLEALSIFQDIGWVDGVEKTKQSISHNLIEQERYKQHLEFQKKQEQERQKEEQELNELIRKRQELTQLEEQKKRLQIEQQHEQAEKIKQRQQEALELLEQGNEKTTQNLFDEAEKDFNHAMTIFQEIKWSHGIKITEEVLKHNAEERSRFLQLQKRDEKARLEQIKQQKELEQMLAKQKLTAQQEARLKELQQAQETEKKFQIQSMQEEAMLYLEKGNEAIQIKKFNQANALFASAMKIFQEMGWQKGIEMTNSALDYNQKELLKFENERLREEQKKQEALRRQEEINQLIKESKAEEIQKQLEWKKKLEEKTQRIDEENSIKDQIFALLERGSKLAAKNEFLSAIELYKKTIPLFEKISWPLKRDQVIDLIDSTQQDYDNYRKHLAKEEAIRKKQAEEEEQMRLLIQSEQEKEKARQKLIQQQQFEQQERDKRNEELRKEAAEEINKASVMLERRKFENAIESLNIALSNFKKLGWDKEAKVTEERIAEVNKQRRETYKPIDREESASDMEISEQGYGQIEEADKFIRQKKYRKALPYLEEAARLFEKIQWTKAIKMVERRIRETEKLITEKEELIEKLRSRRSRKTEKEAYQLLEKVDKFRRENHYDYALTSAKEAQRIFQDLKWEKEAAELDKLIHTIEKENEEQKVVRTQEQSERMEKIKVEEEEERKIQEIIEERRRRRRETRQKLKDE